MSVKILGTWHILCLTDLQCLKKQSMLFLSLTDSLKLNFNLQAKSINLTSSGSLVDSVPQSNNPLQVLNPKTLGEASPLLCQPTSTLPASSLFPQPY